MIIRNATPKDTEKISFLTINNLIYVNSKDYSSKIIRELCKEYSTNKILKRLKQGKFIVAAENNNIIGTGRLENNTIYDVFVDIKQHRKGIGKKIMNYLENLAIRNNIEILIVPASKTALPFYKKLGYKPLNKKTKSSIFMEKRLIT